MDFLARCQSALFGLALFMLSGNLSSRVKDHLAARRKVLPDAPKDPKCTASVEQLVCLTMCALRLQMVEIGSNGVLLWSSQISVRTCDHP